MIENDSGNNADQANSSRNENSAPEQWRKHHLVYSVFFSLLFTLLDFIFVWPENHFWALVAAWGAISAVAWAEFRRQLAVVVTSISLAAAVAIYADVGPSISPEIEVSGTLLPGQSPTPTNACSGSAEVTANSLTFIMGENAAVSSRPGKAILLSVGKCPVVSMERTNFGVAVNATIYDEFGKLIAEINNGQIHAIEGANVHISRGGDLTQVTITNDDGQVLFHEHYLNPTTLSVEGQFGCPGHPVVDVRDGMPITGSIMTHICATNWGMADENAAAFGVQ